MIQVALMQLLEHGTVRNDPMPAGTASGRQSVYYAEVVPGGRGGDNMKRTRFSPEGDLVAKETEAPKDPKKK